MTLRIRDRGGGVAYDNLPDIWKYSYTTVREEEEVRPCGVGRAEGWVVGR